MAQKQMDEDFLLFESKVDQVLRLLEEMSSSNKSDAETGVAEVKPPAEVDESCIVTVRENRKTINKKPDQSEKNGLFDPSEMNKFTFMQQVEQDAEARAKARQERERVAQNFRTLGNEAFRKQNYEKAILMYTKAVEHVKDSPILYNNRALSYIKLKNYKRGIVDCDFVLNKLDEKNLRAWLYRAAAYKRLNDEYNYETSIKFAKKNNSKQAEFIQNFIEKLRTEF